MSLIISDRIRGAAKARRFAEGHEPDWVRKAAEYPNANNTLPSGVPDQAVALGDLSEGDTFSIVAGGHGIVRAEARNGLVLVDTGTGNRYLPDTTPVFRSAPESHAV